MPPAPTRSPRQRRPGAGEAPSAEDRRRRGFLWRWRRVAYAALILAIVAIGGTWVALNTVRLPPAKRPVQTSFVCAIDVPAGRCGFDSAMARLSTSEERVVVSYDDLPPVLVQAVLSAEDRNFFDHNGVDPAGIGRAVLQDVLGSSRSQQGGSTITQQYVKSVYLTSERTLTRKLKEAVLAVKLEQTFDKREILTRYLNEVYFGRGAYGVEAASRAYFGVGVKQLTLSDAAYLAGLIRGPERADATRDSGEATRRRQTVLRAMVEEHYVSRDAAKRAAAVQWTDTETAPDGTRHAVILPRVEERSDFGDVKYGSLGSKYWVQWIRQQLRDRFGPGAETRGLRVYTSFDPRMQKYAVDAVNGTLNQPNGPIGSLVAVDRDGRIRAMVGGSDFDADQVNLALGRSGGGSGRPPGSTFKPFALAAFVEDGYSVRSKFRAPPTTQFPGVYGDVPGKLWQPKNYDRADHGVQSVDEATRDSTNTVYAGIVDTITPKRLADMATRLGVRSRLDPSYSLVLGTEEVSVLDMASAYSTFADRGRHVDPYAITRIEAADGEVLFDASSDVQSEQVIDPEVADTVTSVLQGVISAGTGTRAALKNPAAGKTGTTNDAKDAWFTGYTCDMTASVWMGYRTPKEMTSYKGQAVAGGSFPAMVWRDFMSKATAGDAPCKFPTADAGTKVLNAGFGLTSRTSTTVPRSTTTVDGRGGSSTTSTTTAASTTVPRSVTTTPVPTSSTTTVATSPGGNR